ncbi:hypothetical protein V6Z11_D01G141600 [Gossypium hirsutum]
MVSQLVKHERIETTVAKAKEIRRLGDNMVQLGKEQGMLLLLSEKMMLFTSYLQNWHIDTKTGQVDIQDCFELASELVMLPQWPI